MNDKTPHADQRYIDGIRENNSVLIREIYKRFSGKVVSYVHNDNRDSDAAKEIIQETLMTIYHV